MGAVVSGIGDAGLFGPAAPAQQNYEQTQATRNNPNLSIGFGMPALGDGLNTAFGGVAGGALTPLLDATGQATNAAFGGLANGIQGNQPAPNTLPTNGMGGGKGGVGAIANNALGMGGQMLNQFGLPQVANALGQVGGAAQQIFPNQQQPITQGTGQLPPGFGALSPIDRSQIGNAQIGFGMPAGGGLYGRDLSGNPNTQQLMGGMGTGTIAPPANRFAPPNAPGVRSAQRTMRPNTRTRAPRTR